MGQPPPRGYDPATEAKLQQWVAAKRGKDFFTADRIRTELRQQGVDPDTVRPANPGQVRSAPPPAPYGHAPPSYGYGGGAGYGYQGGGGGYSGYAPPPYAQQPYAPPGGGYSGGYSALPAAYGAPPPHAGGGGPSPGAYDPATEAKLQQWVSAKRAKDFFTADRIREELRAQGVDPDTVRPAHPGAGVGAGAKRPRSEYEAPPPHW